LRWNDFESNISVAFQELREDKDFFDVTLACDENQIQAHKVILSACSPFFRTVLKRNKHEHPLLYLKGVKYSDIVAVLNFMYHGEVNVAQEDLNSFLAVAEDLKVKGLTQNAAEKSRGNQPTNHLPKPRVRDTPEKTDIQPPPPLKRARPAPQAPIVPKFSAPHVDDIDIEEVNHPIKTEPINITHDRSPIAEDEETYHDNNTGIVVAEQSMETGTYNDEYSDYASYEAGYDGAISTPGASGNADGNKGCEDIWSKLEKNGKIIRCRICGLNKHQDFFATLINHIRKDHL